MLVCLYSIGAKIGDTPRQHSINFADATRILHPSIKEAWTHYIKRSQEAEKEDLLAAADIANQPNPVLAPYAYSRESVSIHNKRGEWFKSTAAEQIALAIVSYQTPSGGWNKNIDYSKGARLPSQTFWVGRDVSPEGVSPEKYLDRRQNGGQKSISFRRAIEPQKWYDRRDNSPCIIGIIKSESPSDFVAELKVRKQIHQCRFG